MNFLRELKYTRRNPEDRYKDFNEGVATIAQGHRISKHVIMLVDCSTSMRGERISQVNKAILKN